MPPRIAVLPSAVADQIAAGEVVERPASVVKELLENALDSGAQSVAIDVTDGGRSSIRVSDDGCGMEREDALLALARHATSKIRSAADLVGVHSYGFRGEALPAICSVSQLVLETAAEDGTGTRVRATAGSVESVEEAARRRGTTVAVSQLFHNAPARLKFLRGARSEGRAIFDLVASVALTMPAVRLTLTHDGRSVLNLPPESALRARVAAIHGAQYADRLLDVEHLNGATHVSGLIERPADVGTGTRRALITVNGRAVRDVGVVRAAEAAYRSAVPAGVRPSLFLNLVVAAADVDVNVHPAKTEVRFRDRWMVERVVEAAVRRALGTPESAATIGVRPANGTASWMLAPSGASDALPSLTAPESLGELAAADAAQEDTAEIHVPPLTQLRRTYMMFEHETGVVLIDQHSAHERILYEQFMGMLERGEAPSQRLLFPLTLHLSPKKPKHSR